MTLATLADVRELTRHLPTDHRSKSTWQRADVADVAIALRIVLMLENVEYRPK
jgi:hypothetical protein